MNATLQCPLFGRSAASLDSVRNTRTPKSGSKLKLPSAPFDVAIIGAGIQAALVLRECRAAGLNACVVMDSFDGGLQTASSQRYIHRGSFYTDSGLIALLGEAGEAWKGLIGETKLNAIRGSSYTAFVTAEEADEHSDIWRRHGISFEDVETPFPEIFCGGKASRFLRFLMSIGSATRTRRICCCGGSKATLFKALRRISITNPPRTLTMFSSSLAPITE